MEIRFYLNGKETVVNAQPERLLVDVLREDLHLTGTKGAAAARVSAAPARCCSMIKPSTPA